MLASFIHCYTAWHVYAFLINAMLHVYGVICLCHFKSTIKARTQALLRRAHCCWQVEFRPHRPPHILESCGGRYRRPVRHLFVPSGVASTLRKRRLGAQGAAHSVPDHVWQHSHDWPAGARWSGNLCVLRERRVWPAATSEDWIQSGFFCFFVLHLTLCCQRAFSIKLHKISLVLRGYIPYNHIPVPLVSNYYMSWIQRWFILRSTRTCWFSWCLILWWRHSTTLVFPVCLLPASQPEHSGKRRITFAWMLLSLCPWLYFTAVVSVLVSMYMCDMWSWRRVNSQLCVFRAKRRCC